MPEGALQIGNTAGNSGLLNVMNNSQLDAINRERFAPKPTSSDETLTHLSGYLKNYWEKAKQNKRPLEKRLLQCMRQVAGEYDPAKMSEIQQMGGSEVFMMITAQKKRDAKAWIMDILRPVGANDRLYTLDPTPIPDLPPEIEEELNSRIMDGMIQDLIVQSAMEGRVIEADDLSGLMEGMTGQVQETVKKAINEKAAEITEKMSKKIDDQMVEGKWYKVFKDVVDDYCTYPLAIMKVPVLKRKKRKVYAPDPMTGKMGLTVEKQIALTFSRVNPWDFYPLADASISNEGLLTGGCFERHRLTRKELQSFIGVPGYKEDAIREVLREYGEGGLREWLWTDTERDSLEGKPSYIPSEKIDALEFYGSIPGKLLVEWGMGADQAPDPDMDYEVNCWKIGSYVIKAVITPDKLDRTPYLISSFDKIPGSIIGNALPESIEDTQAMCNAAARAVHNNMGIASGPQVEINTDRVDNPDDIWPWKIWECTDEQMTGAPAVRFYQPSMHAEPLMSIYDKFKKEADHHSGIPAFAHGDTNVGGAGNTSSGLNMLMSAAARGIKSAVSNLDTDIIAEGAERMFDHNMLYDPDESIKGDARVKAGGSASIIAAENLAVRRGEFMDKTNNEVDMALIGLNGREYQLREGAKSVEMDPEKLLQGDAMNPMNPAMAGGGGQQEGAKNLLPDGSESGGDEAKLFRNDGGT